jgi:hypothetical protein
MSVKYYSHGVNVQLVNIIADIEHIVKRQRSKTHNHFNEKSSWTNVRLGL